MRGVLLHVTLQMILTRVANSEYLVRLVRTGQCSIVSASIFFTIPWIDALLVIPCAPLTIEQHAAII